MTLSILHRATGVALSFGLIVLALWLMNVLLGGASYEQFLTLMSGVVGRVLLLGWSFAFFLHLANGVRHLFWDFGRGFEISQANASAWFVLLLATGMTAIFWLLL